jgi:hypothetical protein
MKIEFIRRPFANSRCGAGNRHRLRTLSRAWHDLLRGGRRQAPSPSPAPLARIEQTVFDFAKKKGGF